MTLILASQSPRRRELLTQLGVSFECSPADIDEAPIKGELPDQYVMRMGLEKAREIAERRADCWVLGSDTSVILGHQIMGKPESKAHALEMLMALSRQTHQVLTSVALVQCTKEGVMEHSKLVSTSVTFRDITKSMAEAYWHTKEPKDKAGAYGIQGLGGMLVSSIEGSYSAVVGLPLAETADLLMDVGIEGWWSWPQA